MNIRPLKPVLLVLAATRPPSPARPARRVPARVHCRCALPSTTVTVAVVPARRRSRPA